RAAPRHRAKGQAVRRPDVLALHAALRDLAVHHRVLPRRRARHGRHVLDVAVHLDPARAARDRHARVPVARARARTETRAQSRMNLAVPADSDGVRLDRFLTSVLPNRSRSQIQRLIEEGDVTIAGKSAKSNQLVKTGQVVTVTIPEPIDP